jgi:hypothetical protein
MTTIDAFSALPAPALHALGNDVIPELLRIVETRADAAETSFAKLARALPPGWRHIVLAARMIEDIEEAGSLAGAFVEVRKKRDVLEVEQLFAALGVERLKRALEDARENTPLLVDDDMDPFDIEELCDVDADSLGLARARLELTKRVRAMTSPFPAGA